MVAMKLTFQLRLCDCWSSPTVTTLATVMVLRVGTAEGTSLIEDKGTVELGWGHRVKTGSKRYEGEWEGH